MMKKKSLTFACSDEEYSPNSSPRTPKTPRRSSLRGFRGYTGSPRGSPRGSVRGSVRGSARGSYQQALLKKSDGLLYFSSSLGKMLSNSFDNLLPYCKIGEGSVGSVWAIKVNGWKACMKIVEKKLVTKKSTESFKTEINVLMNIPNGNHLVKFLGYQETKYSLKIIMTLYDGNLQNIVKYAKQNDISFFSPKLIINYMLQLCRGLLVLHENNIIHRDIKSHNIFFEGRINDYKNVTLVLGDFGECKIITEKDKAKTCIGTNGWIAPEVLNSYNKNEYTFSADIWSLGMVFYELLSLQYPYHDTEPLLIAKRVLSEELPGLSDFQKEKYGNIINVWESMVSFIPDKRPSVGGLLDIFNDKLDSIVKSENDK